MAKWVHCEGHFGYDAIRYREQIGGVDIKANIYDCDGDMITWSVSENGKHVASGSVSPDYRSGEKAFDKAWNLAKRRAELVICYGADGIRKLMEKQKAENVSVPA